MIYNVIFFIFLLYFTQVSTSTCRNLRGRIINREQSQICVWLSGASYCEKDKYLNMQLSGPAMGFKVTDVLYDSRTDLQGFIGIKSTSIYIAFRGSSSILNWLDDFEVKKVPYTTFTECINCKVHNGFFKAAANLKTQTLDAIYKLKFQYPNYDIIVTGHSLGGAIAQLIAMELYAKSIISQLYNYGQPRVGNMEYSEFVNKKINEIWRFTHNKDMVPHVPPLKEMDYHHSCGEIFQDKLNNLHICSVIDCEDPACADQYSVYETNVKDHETYLNHTLSCKESIQ